MPHEVIMPALGMAQESGVIVAWRKAAGDEVAAGDILMEVETDKATMEVEAAADGYLTDLRAGEGDEVPVGEVVALISENPEGAGEDAPASASDAPAAAPEGRDVIMPALGMAQESGRILAWLKAPGAEVAAGDALLEVETDKATMEVEADASGYLAAVYGAEGDDVPVGQVIAVISAEKPDAPVVGGAAPAAEAKAPKPETTAAERPAPPAADATANSDARAASTAFSTGRILASPKARRLASERGLDLARLVEAGHPQPFHFADLDVLAALPEPSARAAPAAVAEAHRIEARPSREGFDAFLAWLAEEEGDATPPEAALAALAAGALREATGAETVALRIDRPGAASEIYADADLIQPTPLHEDGPAATPTLILRDLSGTRLTSMSLGAEDAPVLTVARRGKEALVTLDYAPGAMDAGTAVAFVDGFAARLEDPLRQLF